MMGISMNVRDARTPAWPTGLFLLVTGAVAVSVSLTLPANTRASAVWADVVLASVATISAIVIARAGGQGRGWASSRTLAFAVGLVALIGAVLAIRALSSTPTYQPSWADLGFLIVPAAILIPLRAEFRQHFDPESRSEIAVDVLLISASLAVIGYLGLRPMGADGQTAASAAVFALIAATLFTSFAALVLWVPSPAHVGQFLVFASLSAGFLTFGGHWVDGAYTGRLPAFEILANVAMLGLAAIVWFAPRRSHPAVDEGPSRIGRPLLTSVAVAAACAALAIVAEVHGKRGIGNTESSILVALLAAGVAIRILVNQLRSTAANSRARQALQQKEAALAETDLALDRVRDAHDTLRDSDEHLRLVFEAAVDGIVELDGKDTIMRANGAFCRMVGLARDHVEGHAWTAIAAAVSGADDSFASLPSTGKGEIRREGEAQPLYLESRISDIPMSPSRRLLLVRDVTAGRVADQTIRSLFQYLQDRDEDRTRIMRRTNAAIEAERNRIARDLHDGPVQGVSAASLSLEAALLMIKAGEQERGMEVLSKIRRELSEEADGLRRLMSGLRPPLLEERGLIPALRETIARFGHDHGIATEFTGGLVAAIPDDLETLAYRVVQEALSNAGKHAGAEKMSVHVESDASQLRIEIVDDGVGFDSQRAREFLREGRVGLASMRERVELANGSFVVHSNPGKGTTIVATLPLETAPARELAIS
jgi:PAS domain S-box-containing protein